MRDNQGAPSEQLGPLRGVRVVDFTTTVLGPLATQILGDLGADVVKVEHPKGDPLRYLGPSRNPGMASMFLGLNRNKRSLVLDLKRPHMRDVVKRLLAEADVVVHNMRAKAAERIGLSYASLSSQNRKLIYASASGYSQHGPHRDVPAFDESIQSVSGIAGLFMQSGEEPRYAPFVIADKVTGHVLASSIMAALFERERSGAGQEIQVPMFETMVEFNLLEHYWGRAFVPPLGEPGYTRVLTATRKPFQTRDGFICVAVTTDEQWKRLFCAIQRPDLAEDPRFATMAQRTFHFEEAFRYLNEALLLRTTAEWVEVFSSADLPHGPVHQLDDILDNAYLRETGFFDEYTHPSEGVLLRAGPAVHFSNTPGRFHRPPPRLGEHTIEVLEEIGLSRSEASLIQSEGCVSSKRPIDSSGTT